MKKNSHQKIAESLVWRYIQTNSHLSKNNAITKVYETSHIIEESAKFTKWLKLSNVENIESIKSTLAMVCKVAVWHEGKLRERGLNHAHVIEYLKQVNCGLNSIRYNYFRHGINFYIRLNDLNVICLFHGYNLQDVLTGVSPDTDRRIKALNKARQY